MKRGSKGGKGGWNLLQVELLTHIVGSSRVLTLEKHVWKTCLVEIGTLAERNWTAGGKQNLVIGMDTAAGAIPFF